MVWAVWSIFHITLIKSLQEFISKNINEWNVLLYKTPNNYHNLGLFDIEVSTTDEKKARTKAEEMCKKLLANLVIEDYKIL